MAQNHHAPAADAGLMTQIDAYCERTNPEFWAEPINAITNGAFIVAAIAGVMVARRLERIDPGAMILAALIVAIGIGSFLFHTVATRWALYADVIPIRLFILAYFILAMRRYFRLPWWAAVPIGVAFIPFSSVLSGVLRDVLGDAIGFSVGYLPALLALFVIGVILLVRSHAAGKELLLAAGIFTISLTFRTLDGPLCDVFPLGTHFMWHILNGVLLGWLLLTMIRHGLPKGWDLAGSEATPPTAR